MEEMKPFPQPVVGGHIQMAPATKPMAMQMPCISTAPPLGPPPQVSVHALWACKLHVLKVIPLAP